MSEIQIQTVRLASFLGMPHIQLFAALAITAPASTIFAPAFSLPLASRRLAGSGVLAASSLPGFARGSCRNAHAAMSPPRASPPRTRREEDRVIYAGAAPPGWDLKVPRKSNDSAEALVDPPRAIADPYGWLRSDDRSSQEVLDHLKAENEYTKSWTSHLEPIKTKIYDELLSSVQETDYTCPRPRNGFYYYSRTYEGKSYSCHFRAPIDASGVMPEIKWDGTADSPILPGEEAILDVNALAEGKSYCSISAMKVSPSQKLLAYTVDDTGGETYKLYVKDLESGNIIFEDDTLETSGNAVWGEDDKTLYYMTMDSAHRPYRLYKKILGSDEEDELLFEELDDVYWSSAGKTLDGKYILLDCSTSETSEIHYIKLPTGTDEDDEDTNKLLCVAKRREKVLYEVEHGHGSWWIASNVGGTPNMRLFTAPATANCEEDWELVTLENDDRALFDGSYERSLNGITLFSNHAVAEGREGGIPRIWILKLGDGGKKSTIQSMRQLTFDESAHDVGLSSNLEFGTDAVAIYYDSLVTPPQTMEIPLDAANDSSDSRKVLKAKNVPGYDKSLYACERTTVLSRDGKTEVPISLVYRKDVMEKNDNGKNPVNVHLYGYGSYGICMEADFGSTRLPLLNRGIVYVIAHVRGGAEMGRQWYEEPNGAKYLCKKNTFNDFVDVAKWLIDDRKLTVPDLLSCEGRSAGGMLIGSSINQAPELFKAAVLGVPFLDVVSTMVDASIPLTAGEWVEWGNPNEEKYLDYMLEYSPMNTVQEGKKYPSCWLTGGLHDPRVQYWEPAKFAATLRHLQDSDASGPVCIKIDMSAGHFSASDRYKYLKELALDYSFLLDQLGLVSESDTAET